MKSAPAPSFSTGRKWLLSLNVLISLSALLAIVLMVNYMGARHFWRASLARSARYELAPLTHRVLESVTNQLRVTVFFDKTDPIYDSVVALLKEYRYANKNITVQTVDYERDPSADLIRATYKLMSNKNLVIFEYNNRTKFVQHNELSDLDIAELVSGQSKEIRRTHFKGELMFTSAIFSLVSAHPLKAYFLQNHNEHPPESDDRDFGYSKFGAVLKRNNVDWARLDLSGPAQIPGDCSLLILAGPAIPLLSDELSKISEYLKGGGRLLLLFNYFGLKKDTGLIQIMADWGVQVGEDIVKDPAHTVNGEDILVTRFGLHPIMQPMVRSFLQMYLPRSVRADPRAAPAAGAPQATDLLYTGESAVILTDIRKGIPYSHPGTDIVTNVCLGVAVEKGRIRDVTADRGTTRLVVMGDSAFLSNRLIDAGGNSDFGALAVNWLLDRSELLGALAPRPITEYRTTLTSSQMTAAQLVLMLAMPCGVLLIGTLVWFRRRS